jgi:NADP-dependent aldehyde dehydrogenase
MPSQSVDPRTAAPFGPVLDDTTADELDAAVLRSREAGRSWAAMGSTVRAAALDAVADALDADVANLAELADQETGLGVTRLIGEVGRTTFQLRMFATAVRAGSHLGIVVDLADPADPPVGHPELRRMLVPLGPVAVFGASNFPFAFSVMGGDTAAALAAGCSVVAKAHPSHPQTSERVAALAISALTASGAPGGTFTSVRGFDVGIGLVTHPGIKAAAFTGSTSGGRALFDLAVGRPEPIPFYGEMGSINPVVVTPGAADRVGLPQEYVASLCMGGGQFCTNPSVILVPKTSRLAEAIVDVIRQQADVMLLNAGILKNLQRNLAELALIPGVESVPASNAGGDDTSGFKAVPMVIVTDVANAIMDDRLLTTECFGPVGIVIEYDGPLDLMELIGRLEGCLVSTIHAEADEELSASVVAALAEISGRIVWNAWPTGLAVAGAQHHGGPYPASTNSLHTSVGTTAMRRFQRPIAFQSVPEHLRPAALR